MRGFGKYIGRSRSGTGSGTCGTRIGLPALRILTGLILRVASASNTGALMLLMSRRVAGEAATGDGRVRAGVVVVVLSRVGELGAVALPPPRPCAAAEEEDSTVMRGRACAWPDARPSEDEKRGGRSSSFLSLTFAGGTCGCVPAIISSAAARLCDCGCGCGALRRRTRCYCSRDLCARRAGPVSLAVAAVRDLFLFRVQRRTGRGAAGGRGVGRVGRAGDGRERVSALVRERGRRRVRAVARRRGAQRGLLLGLGGVAGLRCAGGGLRSTAAGG